MKWILLDEKELINVKYIHYVSLEKDEVVIDIGIMKYFIKCGKLSVCFEQIIDFLNCNKRNLLSVGKNKKND